MSFEDFFGGADSFDTSDLGGSSAASQTSAPTSGGWGSATTHGVINLGGSLIHNRQAREASQDARRWSEQMSNTSWQRGVRDMIAAGINPMLAASKGGASTPGTEPAKIENLTANAVGSAQQGAMVTASVDKIRAETENIKADTILKDRQEMGVRYRGAVDLQKVDNLIAEIANIRAELPKIHSETARNRAEEELARKMAELRSLESIHSGLDLARAGSEMRYFSGPGGTYRPYLHDVGSFVSSASGAAVGLGAARFASQGLRSSGGRVGLGGRSSEPRPYSKEWRDGVRARARERNVRGDF